MDDDGLLVNFDAGDTATVRVSSAQYKGKWKERALSKKWDSIKLRRALGQGPQRPGATGQSLVNKPVQPVQGEVRNKPEHNSVQESISRPLKRKRTVASSANATPLMPRSFTSSSLFTSNPEIPDSKPKEPESKPKEVKPTPTPATTGTPGDFVSLGINPMICSHLNKSLEITTPTEIQRLAIPHLLQSTQDTFIRAQTGSGKTLAFILPILHTLLSLPEHKNYDRTSGLFAIILSPTRELAKQIEAVITMLTAGTWVVPGWFLGGEKKKSEKARLRKGVNVLVATPGRLADHLESTKVLDTSLVRWIVLDEGDRLVDMGFLDTIGKILRIVEGRVQHQIMKARREGVLETKLPSRLVKVLCSATLRGEEGLGALETIVDPVFLRAETTDVDQVLTPGELTQKAVILPAKLRLVTLCAVTKTFTHDPVGKMIIFFSCTTSVDFHHQLLSSMFDVELFQLYGSLEQPVRTATLKAFTATKGRAILLATDVASRGLDLPFVDMILQFDPPLSQDDYIHRVGRTARAGRKGEGLLFLLPSEEEYISALEGHGASIKRISYESIMEDGFGKDWMNEATKYQLQAEKWILQDQEVFP